MSETISISNYESNTIFGSSSTITPAYDTKEPQPKVKYVKVKPKRVVMVCRCGGKLDCKGGMTRGQQTLWDNQCPKCYSVYQTKERAGDIVYE